MAGVEAITQTFEGCALEKSAVPELSEVRRGRYHLKDVPYLDEMQWGAIVPEDYARGTV
jgi:hypothetical protein